MDGIPSTGRRIEIPYCNVIETKDGKIVRERDYWDNQALLRQLGVDAWRQQTTSAKAAHSAHGRLRP